MLTFECVCVCLMQIVQALTVLSIFPEQVTGYIFVFSYMLMPSTMGRKLVGWMLCRCFMVEQQEPEFSQCLSHHLPQNALILMKHAPCRQMQLMGCGMA